MRVVRRTFYAIVASSLVLYAAAKRTDEKLWWKGMVQRNERYDWLRPPDEIFQRAIDLGYFGKLKGRQEANDLPWDRRARLFGYVFDKHLAFPGSRWIIKVALETAAATAANGAIFARKGFKAKPRFEDELANHNSLTVYVVTFAPSRTDTPDVMLDYEDRVMIPEYVNRGTSDDVFDKRTCLDLSGTCWRNSKSVFFRFPESQRVTGIGYLILQWAGGEHRIPVHFDYLW